MHKLVIIAICILTITAYAQDPCGDLNCNGWCYEISDFVMAVRVVANRCDFDSLQQCTIYQGDVDEDGYPLTIGDALAIGVIINSDSTPDFSRHPESDTIEVGSVDAAPGETVELPIYIKTIDTISAFQISIETDPAYVVIDSLVASDSLIFDYSYCSGQLYGGFFTLDFLGGDPILLLPGEYHIADLIVTVNGGVQEPDTTQIIFTNNPGLFQYTAFSNIPFFIPVTVDGEIRIIPTGIDDGELGNIPEELSINAYPNPFNASTTLEYGLPEPGHVRVCIYDPLGRMVDMLLDREEQAGQHRVVWDASDRTSGIYFYRLETGDFAETRKMILMK